MALKLGTLVAYFKADTSGLKKGEREVTRVSKTMEKGFNRVGKALTVAISIETARRLLLVADNMRVMERRLVRWTGSADAAEKTMRRLTTTASDTGQAVSDTLSIFERFSLVRGDIGATNEDILQLVDTVSKLGALGGSSEDEMRNALRQMSQSFAGGIVRAEEYNSIVENTPEIIKAIAREMDLTMGEVRNRMLDGKLTAQDVFQAMKDAAEETNVQFDAMPKSVTMAAQALKNELAAALADTDTVFSQTVAGWLNKLAGFVSSLTNLTTTHKRQLQVLERIGELQENIGRFNEMNRPRLPRRQQNQRDLEELAALQAELKAFEQAYIDARNQPPPEVAGPTAPTGENEIGSGVENRLNAIRRLGESERQAIERDMQETRDFVRAQDHLTESERRELLENLAAEKFRLIEELAQREREARMDPARIDAIRQMGETERQEIERQFAQEREFILSQVQLTAGQQRELTEALAAEKFRRLEEIAQGELEIERRKSKELLAQKMEEAQQMVALMNSTSSAISNVLSATGGDVGAKIGAILSQVAQLATTMITIKMAEAQAQAGADPSAVHPLQKIANMAIVASQYASLFSLVGSALGGGRMMGGTTSPALAHPVNEGGVPELLERGGRQFLLPDGRGGRISRLQDASTASPGAGSAAPVIHVTVAPSWTVMDDRGVEEVIRNQRGLLVQLVREAVQDVGGGL